MMMMNGRNNRYPFTATQWQELEHQALIFKYMASGHPIPSDLLLPIRRSILLDTTSTPASLFPHQNNIAWGCFQMGLGRKMEDPEPGRCRRTDGKKWRCSKEAHPDSKYCERHMHRGKNRSRKPVEAPPLNTNNTINNTSSSSITTASNSNSSHQSSSTYVSSLYPTTNNYQLSMGNSDTHDPFYPYSSCPSYSRPPAIGLSPGKFQLDSGSSTSTDRDFRYFHGMREDVDQYSCFTEASGSERDGAWRFTPLGMSSLGEPKQRSFIHQQQQQQQQQDCYSHLTTTTDLSKEGEGEKHQNFFVLGSDFKLQTPSKDHDNSRLEEEEEESRKPLRRFIDEWPLKNNKESWIDLEEDRSNWSSSSSSLSKTQLSISTPTTYHDHFAIANSQSRDGN